MITFLKKISPNKETLQKYKFFKIFGNFINKPNLWHFNCPSVSKAFAVGLFFAWIPVPFQMPVAALGALAFNANLPLSVALVWLTNPITMPPLFLFSYIIGARILGLPIKPIKFELSTQWLTSFLGDLWKPFLLGCFICALISSIVGYFSIKIAWRCFVIHKWNKRKQQRYKSKNINIENF